MTSPTPEPILLAWSGGKDSALALAALQADPAYDVVALLTTFSEEAQATQMHRVPVALLQAQADALGLPLHAVHVPLDPANTIYEARMQAALEHFQARGVNTCAFGDLFLEDIRAYREGNLARIGMQALFPLWDLDTPALARRFIADGFQALSFASTRPTCRKRWPGMPTTRPSWTRCRPASIPAAKTGSSTASSSTGQTSASRWPSHPASASPRATSAGTASRHPPGKVVGRASADGVGRRQGLMLK